MWVLVTYIPQKSADMDLQFLSKRILSSQSRTRVSFVKGIQREEFTKYLMLIANLINDVVLHELHTCSPHTPIQLSMTQAILHTITVL